MDLAKVVSTQEQYDWRSTVWDLKTDSHATIDAADLPST